MKAVVSRCVRAVCGAGTQNMNKIKLNIAHFNKCICMGRTAAARPKPCHTCHSYVSEFRGKQYVNTDARCWHRRLVLLRIVFIITSTSLYVN